MSSDNSTQLIIIFVGPPGSGKSTLAIPWCDRFQNWTRINQDELGSRKKCEWKAQKALSEGKSVIIDRCNFDQSQRKVWIQIANKFQVPIDCLVFRIPFNVLKNRVFHRRDHPTGVEGYEGIRILSEFSSNIKPPTLREGIDRIVTFSSVRGPVFDEQTWNWLQNAFSVPIILNAYPVPLKSTSPPPLKLPKERPSKQISKSDAKQNFNTKSFNQNPFLNLELVEED